MSNRERGRGFFITKNLQFSKRVGGGVKISEKVSTEFVNGPLSRFLIRQIFQFYFYVIVDYIYIYTSWCFAPYPEVLDLVTPPPWMLPLLLNVVISPSMLPLLLLCCCSFTNVAAPFSVLLLLLLLLHLSLMFLLLIYVTAPHWGCLSTFNLPEYMSPGSSIWDQRSGVWDPGSRITNQWAAFCCCCTPHVVVPLWKYSTFKWHQKRN